MTSYLFLAAAITCEVAGTLALRVAAGGARRWYAVTLMGYSVAFAFLSLALADGLGLGLAYGIWAAAGVTLTAIASHFLFGEPLTRVMVGGIALIVAGVLLIELGAVH